MIFALVVLAGFVPSTGSAPGLDYGPEPELSDYASGIPVVAYHHVTTHQSKYSVTPYRLRNDLELLYEAGFFLILPSDIEDGLRRVPFNRRPIMITFDDGWEDNFRYIDGENGDQLLDPDCAVAIVNDFIEEHPEFGRGVVFFVSWDKVPFGNNTQQKLNALLDMGHCIGNHSADHLSFTRIPPSKYCEQIIPALNSFRQRLGLRTDEINVVAYPGGQIPRNSGAESTLSAMEYDDRPAVLQGYLVNGAVESFKNVYGTQGNPYRISRIDMALYSVQGLLGWSNIMVQSEVRPSLHDDLPWRP